MKALAFAFAWIGGAPFVGLALAIIAAAAASACAWEGPQ